MVSFEDFKKIELKIAQIKEVVNHPNADKLYVLTIDLGQEMRQIVAGIRPSYAPEALVGRHIVVAANLEPATIRGVQSQGMLLAASDEQGIAVLGPDRPVALGSTVK
jgi:methionyl-tRNA synthetase